MRTAGYRPLTAETPADGQCPTADREIRLGSERLSSRLQTTPGPEPQGAIRWGDPATGDSCHHGWCDDPLWKPFRAGAYVLRRDFLGDSVVTNTAKKDYHSVG